MTLRSPQGRLSILCYYLIRNLLLYGIVNNLFCVNSQTVAGFISVGSFVVGSGPGWQSSSLCLNCVQVCAILFGGSTDQYSCSTSSSEVNFLAFVDGYGDITHCGSNPVSQSFLPMTFYSGYGAFSAYIHDHECTARNYCYSGAPSSQPTGQPSSQPATHPSRQPTGVPTSQPTRDPMSFPTTQPSGRPSRQPSGHPSAQPSAGETAQPTCRPSVQPSAQPVSFPTGFPSGLPSVQPSSLPTSLPSRLPSSQPTNQPISRPSSQPSTQPSSQPSKQPNSFPSTQPTAQPNGRPSNQPTCQPTSQPSCQPNARPSAQPSRQPSSQPSNQPISFPTALPSSQPSSQPTGQPSSQPTRRPSLQPSNHPSSQPSNQPISSPSIQPSSQPTSIPTEQPSSQPTGRPVARPSSQPTRIPSGQPSNQPTRRPSSQPSSKPATFPSSQPTRSPTGQPSSGPSGQPSSRPSSSPFSEPTNRPSSHPTVQPTGLPTAQPSSWPSSRPSVVPSGQPSCLPSIGPSSRPSCVPFVQPTTVPSNQPSGYPTVQPSSVPSSTPSNQPTDHPSASPSVQPSESPSSQPTLIPSSNPSALPTNRPSDQPTGVPSRQPASFPTSQPLSFPSNQPTGHPSSDPSSQPTDLPTSQPSNKPTNQPTIEPSSQPTVMPTRQPSQQPSNRPTGSPSGQPSALPTNQPTVVPSIQPSNRPSNRPTGFPTNQPSNFPSSCPSRQPTDIPSCQPSIRPTSQPTMVPSVRPTSLPTEQPTVLPTCLPTSQPSRCPSVQPVSSPSACPSSQPILIPTAQPFAVPTSAPQATIYQTNGVLFYLGVTSSTNKTVENKNNPLGSSFILFGRNSKHQSGFPQTISLDSSMSHEFVSPIISNEAGIRNDITIRSTTIVGDINGDGFLDLLVGYPLTSKCSVYLGDGVNDFATIITTKGESFAIIGDPYQGGGFLGWSSIRAGDLNGDEIDEIMISAIYANVIYVIYGRTHFEKTINILEEVTNNKKGFQIQGSDQEMNFGVSLTLLHHFRKGSHADIAVTAQRPTGGQCVVYILFGGVLFNEPGNLIAIDQIKNNPMVCLRIVTPLYSFAGFSLAGIGDINSDGYDDLAIGSVPYFRGSYVEQKTYILYGRVFNASEREFALSEMSEKDGIIITGGGFMVTGVGDVNGDNVADVMISSYYDWKGQKSAYLISIPANMTYSPSLQPSSSPTMTTTVASNYSLFPNDTNSTSFPVFAPSFRPSFVPSLFNSSSTTRLPTRVVFAVGTARPSAGKPSLAPSLSPTSGYHHLRGFPTKMPSPMITGMPTINTTVFTEIECSSAREDKEDNCHRIRNGTHFLFRIIANAGIVKIVGNEEGGAKNVYVLYPPKERVDVIIENFRVSTDIISVAHLNEAGYSYFSLETIAYSLKNGQPLTLLFCTENTLQITLLSHTKFDLQAANFLFTQEDNQVVSQEQGSYRNTILAKVQIGIVAGVLFFLLCVFSALSYQHKLEEKEKEKQEQNWLQSLMKGDLHEVEALNPLPESPSHSSSVSSRSSSSDSSSREDDVNECWGMGKDLSQSKNDEKDDESSTVVVVHEDNEKNDEPIPMNLKNVPNNANQAEILLDENHHSVPPSLPLALPDGGANRENNDVTSINSNDWEDALAFSDEEVEKDNDDNQDEDRLISPKNPYLPMETKKGRLTANGQFPISQRNSSMNPNCNSSTTAYNNINNGIINMRQSVRIKFRPEESGPTQMISPHKQLSRSSSASSSSAYSSNSSQKSFERSSDKISPFDANNVIDDNLKKAVKGHSQESNGKDDKQDIPSIDSDEWENALASSDDDEG
jgi:hypothetical protein